MSGQRRAASSIVANPVLVGGVTLLVVVVAVFLAYNANSGLPFVPTYQIDVEVPNAARLVPGNDVMQGGYRVGAVKELKTIKLSGGRTGAQLTLALEKGVGPLPRDTRVVIRPRSTLGLKYVELTPGSSKRTIPEGGTLRATMGAARPELDDLFETFTDKTRRDIAANLGTFGAGLSSRGKDLNRTLLTLDPLLEDVQPVMRTLSDPDTRLVRFFTELQDTAAITLPVVGELSHGFTAGADVFDALSKDPEALDQTIARSPRTLREGVPALIGQRPFLTRFANLSDEIAGTAQELRRSVAPTSRALQAGTEVLPDTPELSERLGTTFTALRGLAESPTTNLTLDGLTTTSNTLNNTLRWLGPHVTVCNYFNYWWTYLSDHISEEVDTGTVQRILVKLSNPLQPNGPASFGATEPANGGANLPSLPGIGTLGDAVTLHAQPYGRAVDENGNADCETGQRGFPRRLAPEGFRPDLNIAVSPRTPGNQGPMYTGRPRVPEGQTFSAEPTGLAPQVAGK